jgi:hypothetical protein
MENIGLTGPVPILLLGVRMTLNPLAWLRYSILALVVVALLMATAVGFVDTGKIHPNSKTGRAITSATHTFVAPVRRTVELRGGHGLSVAAWFGITAVVTGAFAATFFEWLFFPKRGIGEAATAPARRSIAIGVTVAFAVILGLVVLGLWGSLAGSPRAAWWMRPFSLPTAWFVDRFDDAIPRVALLNLAAGAMYGLLRLGRWFFVRAT